MSKEYQITSKKNSHQIARFLAANSQAVLPMVDLIEQSMMAIDDLVETLGRATIEAVLEVSAANVAGERHQGLRSGNEVGWHGSQGGESEDARVSPEASQEGGRRGRRGERSSLRGDAVGLTIDRSHPQCDDARGVDAQLQGDSARGVRVSKSSISRQFVLECARLLERRFDDVRMLVIYIDGIVVADHSVIAAVGIDENGYKHVLGIADGATENAAVVKDLLGSMVERGIKPGVRRLGPKPCAPR